MMVGNGLTPLIKLPSPTTIQGAYNKNINNIGIYNIGIL